jgi:ATP-dependent Clp protease adaptor protein ClpS
MALAKQAPGLYIDQSVGLGAAVREPSGSGPGGFVEGFDPSVMNRSLFGTIKSEMRWRPVASEPRSPGGDDDGRHGTAIITKTKPRTKRPNLYRVLLLNDDYTPMEFVVHVLERFFNKSREDATRIMLHVHQNGVGECGVFTYEVAETKVTQVMDFARKHQHPLQCVMEKK